MCKKSVLETYYGTKAYSLSTLAIITLILCKGFLNLFFFNSGTPCIVTLETAQVVVGVSVDAGEGVAGKS